VSQIHQEICEMGLGFFNHLNISVKLPGRSMVELEKTDCVAPIILVNLMTSKVASNLNFEAKIVSLPSRTTIKEIVLVHGSCLIFNSNCGGNFGVELVKKQPPHVKRVVLQLR
jgi:hypothetical protein